MRPLLQKSNVSDQQLIREVTIAATTEFEHKAKFLASQRQCTPKATCSHVATPGNDSENTDKMKIDPKGKGLVDQVAALQAQIASLRKSMGPAGSTRAKPRPQVGKPRMCEAFQNEKVERCVHCLDVVALSIMHGGAALDLNRETRETDQVYHHGTGRRPVRINRVN